MKITVKAFHAVGEWRWETTEEACAICFQPFDGCCESCRFPGEECPPVWGECDHHFHIHCITRWLSQDNKNCPMCRREFKFKQNAYFEIY